VVTSANQCGAGDGQRAGTPADLFRAVAVEVVVEVAKAVAAAVAVQHQVQNEEKTSPTHQPNNFSSNTSFVGGNSVCEMTVRECINGVVLLADTVTRAGLKGLNRAEVDGDKLERKRWTIFFHRRSSLRQVHVRGKFDVSRVTACIDMFGYLSE
jgi:hypothetical protein